MAEDEADALRQAEIGTEHLLLALLREERGLAARVIQDLGVQPADLERRVRLRLTTAEIGADGPIGLGPEARAAFDLARTEATRLHHEYLGTEHLLLGLLRNGEGPAFVALNGVGVTFGKVRQQILRILREAASDRPAGGAPADLADVGRRRVRSRIGSAGASQPRDEPERCGRCGRVRRSDWRFCAYCGERWPACDQCQAPLPRLAGVRFCPGCGLMLEPDARA